MYSMLSCSVVPDSFATPWTVARQASLPMGSLAQARIPEWIIIDTPKHLLGTFIMGPITGKEIRKLQSTKSILAHKVCDGVGMRDGI